MAACRILLIRHGQSTWNAEDRWQGQQDPPLSPLGIQQAHEAAESLGTFDLIGSSTLERAHSTASIIANALGIGPVITDAGLMERYSGGFETLTRTEIEERFPGYLASGERPDDYETDESIIERATGALARLAGLAGDGSTALVVGHGGVIRAIERTLEAERTERLPNLGGRWLEIGPGIFRAGDAVTLVEGDKAYTPNIP